MDSHCVYKVLRSGGGLVTKVSTPCTFGLTKLTVSETAITLMIITSLDGSKMSILNLTCMSGVGDVKDRPSLFR